MKQPEALSVAKRCLPAFAAAGLPALSASDLRVADPKTIARLWAGMGSVYELTLTAGGETAAIVVKYISLPAACASIGDERKRVSYHCEAAFYNHGHAARLVAAGCAVPRPLLAEVTSEGKLTICMTRLGGRGGSMGLAQSTAAVCWLARMHAAYWGAERADAAVASGLQEQGGYWYLDTRPDEWASMPQRGWEGRLRLAARAIDERLKAEPMQTVVHGDAKDANMLFTQDASGGAVAAFYDFQYAGKAPPTKDLAYALTCASNAAADEDALVGAYHTELTKLLQAQGDTPPSLPMLRESLALAYCDLGRWMSGWGWWGHDLRGKIEAVLERLDGGRALGSEAEYASAMAREFPL